MEAFWTVFLQFGFEEKVIVLANGRSVTGNTFVGDTLDYSAAQPKGNSQQGKFMKRTSSSTQLTRAAVIAERALLKPGKFPAITSSRFSQPKAERRSANPQPWLREAPPFGRYLGHPCPVYSSLCFRCCVRPLS
jgi:hypothetical protein